MEVIKPFGGNKNIVKQVERDKLVYDNQYYFEWLEKRTIYTGKQLKVMIVIFYDGELCSL